MDKDSEKSLLRLYRSGYSLNRLSKLSSLPKTTVYYHTRRAFGKYYSEPYFNSKLESELGEFLGAFAGDGSFYLSKSGLYMIRFYLAENELKYAQHLSNIVHKLFNKTPRIWHDYSHHLFRLTVFGKHIYKLIRTYLDFTADKSHTVKLNKATYSYNKVFLSAFAGALVATDGSHWRKSYNVLYRIASSSRAI